ncbi:hypothetical protein [Clostridium botulinum]|uniref:hypothetical protein n=1 Tax=Clostridium botulinum TaxID=1491 RepID=UPI001E5B7808|nr:hypothetical protein [Clostridium botulinum]
MNNLTLEEALFFMELEDRKKKAESFDTSKVNLKATGEELREILEDLQGKKISNYYWKAIQHCMDYNSWSLKEIVEYRSLLQNKSKNILRIVSCSKGILQQLRIKNNRELKIEMTNNATLNKKLINLVAKSENSLSCWSN